MLSLQLLSAPVEYGYNWTTPFYDAGHRLAAATMTNGTSVDGRRHQQDDSYEYYPMDEETQLILAEIHFYSVLHKRVVPAVFCLIIAVGLIGNSLVVGVTLSRRKMRSSTVSLLLLNLAASDLLFLVVCVPFMAYHFAADNWVLGDAACKLAQYTLYVTVYVTVYTLVAIAIIRYSTQGIIFDRIAT